MARKREEQADGRFSVRKPDEELCAMRLPHAARAGGDRVCGSSQTRHFSRPQIFGKRFLGSLQTLIPSFFVGIAAQNGTPLFFRQAAPNTKQRIGTQSVRQTFNPHRARKTHTPRLPLRRTTHEKRIGIRTRARRMGHPRLTVVHQHHRRSPPQRPLPTHFSD